MYKKLFSIKKFPPRRLISTNSFEVTEDAGFRFVEYTPPKLLVDNPFITCANPICKFSRKKT